MPDITLSDIAQASAAPPVSLPDQTTTGPNASEIYSTKLSEEAKKIPTGIFNFAESNDSHANDKIFGDSEGKTFRLINPKGEIENVPPEKSIDLFHQGYQFADPNAQIGLDAHLQAFQSNPDWKQNIAATLHKAGTLGSEGINNIINPIDDPKTSNNERYAQIADRILSSNFPVANFVGSAGSQLALGSAAAKVGGWALGGMQGPARIADVVAGKIASPATQAIGGLANIGAKAVGEAAQVGAITAPSAAIQALIDKDPQGAAESMAIGLGIGGVVGGLGAGLAGLAGKLAKPSEASKVAAAASNLSGIEDAGDKEALLQEYEKTIPNIRKLVSAYKPGNPKTFAPSIIEKLSRGQGPIAIALDKLTKEQSDYALGELGDIPENKVKTELPKIAAGDRMWSTLNSLDNLAEDTELPRASNITATLEGFKGSAPETVDKLISDITKITNEEGTIPLTKTQQFVSSLVDKIDWSSNAPEDVAMKSIFDSAFKELKDSADNIARNSAEPKLINQWSNDQGLARLANELRLAPSIAEAETKEMPNIVAKIGERILRHGVTSVGYLGGGPVGGIAANELFNATKRLVGSWIDSSETKIAPFLNKMVEHSAIGSFIVGDAIHQTNKKIEDSPAILRASLEKSAPIPSQQNIVKSILGPEATNGVSSNQQFHKFANAVAMAAGNPEAMKSTVDQLLGPVSISHPQLANDMSNHLVTKINYIHSLIPKNPNVGSSFYLPEAWNPTKAQLSELNSTLEVVQKPEKLLENAARGTITDAQVNAIQTLYPRTLERMRNKVASESHSIKANYQQRIGLTKFLAHPIDPTLADIQSLQAAYAPVQPQQAGGGGRGHRGKSPKLSDELPMAQPTPSQRINST